MPTFELERQFTNNIVAGVDEAGCGPWAGPVVAAAAVWHEDAMPYNSSVMEIIDLIDDSKKLSKSKREKVYECLLGLPGSIFEYGLGQASVAEIDTVNIGQATLLAMSRAVGSLQMPPDVVLVDGIRKPELGSKVITVIKGDQVSFSIAAASIIAKVSRDQIMEELSSQFPDYGWRSNSGYGTAQHQEALRQHGVTEHHRRSYSPIAKLLA